MSERQDLAELSARAHAALSRTGPPTLSNLRRALADAGLALEDDPRLRPMLKRARGVEPDATLDAATLGQLCDDALGLIQRALDHELIIPDFVRFREQLERLFERASVERGGTVADYIPQLGRVDPEQFGVAICTVDGQRASFGDARTDFCVQSCCKPINYCMALEEHGEQKVHSHVGREPSGRGFNELAFNALNQPHNPLINAGAIACCALIGAGMEPADRFDLVMRRWRELSGGAKPGFSNATYLSERATADRNFALGYLMRERGVFPPDTDLIETLEFYFQCCSIEQSAERMAVVASTLARGGICPLDPHQSIFKPRTVRNCLSLMHSCGMYDFSGEFAFSIGLPAKSGVAGALLIVVPNVMGLCTWSPRLDDLGNSVRGVAFCKALVETFNFHPYDSLTGLPAKNDPRRPHSSSAPTRHLS